MSSLIQRQNFKPSFPPYFFFNVYFNDNAYYAYLFRSTCDTYMYRSVVRTCTITMVTDTYLSIRIYMFTVMSKSVTHK